ncbi:hypothetical protein RhiirC2_200430 [Rhizophagus irregularis]|uniref:Uncharacterized protein n=1 Tax=Rhizophagus irregularis TaxID=588596 RepID=A0A2N1MJI9_9GLOM|nr:hypothetical protein RhiirC2_200430 [Rhizophagus irregularis]
MLRRIWEQGLSCNIFFFFFFLLFFLLRIASKGLKIFMRDQEMQAFQWFKEISWLVGWLVGYNTVKQFLILLKYFNG